MNKHSQNRPSLGRIYRESAADASHRPVASIDADLLANAAGGVLSNEDRENAISAIANSAIEADLFRLLQALQQASRACTSLAPDTCALGFVRRGSGCLGGCAYHRATQFQTRFANIRDRATANHSAACWGRNFPRRNRLTYGQQSRRIKYDGAPERHDF